MRSVRTADRPHHTSTQRKQVCSADRRIMIADLRRPAHPVLDIAVGVHSRIHCHAEREKQPVTVVPNNRWHRHSCLCERFSGHVRTNRASGGCQPAGVRRHLTTRPALARQSISVAPLGLCWSSFAGSRGLRPWLLTVASSRLGNRCAGLNTWAEVGDVA